MINKFLLAIVFVFTIISVKAQDVSQRDADSLLNSLIRPTSDTGRINALISLTVFNLNRRHITSTQLSAAALYISEAQNLNNKLKVPVYTNRILLLQAGLYKARGNTAAGQVMLDKIIERLKNGKDKALLGKAYFELSEYYSGDFLHQTMQARIKYLQMAIAAYTGTNHYVELARCYRFLADLHQLTNDNTTAFAEVRTALKYYNLGNYKETQGAYSLLGRLYYEQGDYKQALHYELMALNIATNSNGDNIRLICQINNNIGYTYFKLNDNQNALTYYLEALRIAEQEKDNGTVYLLAANIAGTYLKLNEPLKAQYFFQDINNRFARPTDKKYEGGDYGISQTYLKIFMALKRYDKGRYYYDRLVSETKNPNINLYALSLYYELITKYNIETRNYAAALSYLKKNAAFLNKAKDFSGLARNYKLWFSLDTARNDYKAAVQKQILAGKLEDSLFNETKSKQIAQLQIQFETDKKENQIKFLNQKATLEKAKLIQADLVKNVTVAGIILMLIIASLLYKQNRLRSKTNVIVTHKNELLQHLLTEKEWLLKEVHHRVKNNLHTVICLLESQATYLEEDALKAIESSQNRIYAMSLIHQKLYQSDDIKTIDIDVYLEEFTHHLSDSFGSPGNIRINLMADKVKLSISQAIPLGLIINEGVTNAFKYAFPKQTMGEIKVQLKQTDNHIKLVIADNGIGMRYIDTDVISNSLGLDLMKGLTTELNGNILFENDNGTKITVFFPIESLDSSDHLHLPHSLNSLEI